MERTNADTATPKAIQIHPANDLSCYAALDKEFGPIRDLPQDSAYSKRVLLLTILLAVLAAGALALGPFEDPRLAFGFPD